MNVSAAAWHKSMSGTNGREVEGDKSQKENEKQNRQINGDAITKMH